MKVLLRFATVLVVVSCAGIAGAADIYVPDEYSTIQEAMDAAISGDRILVRAGTYYENIILKDGITLQGEEANTTIIDGGGSGSVIEAMNLTSGEISQFTIQNGHAERGGGIRVDVTGSMVIRNNVIRNNSAVFGAGIYGPLDRSIVKNNVFTHNSGRNGGAIDANSGEYLFTNNIVIHNTASNHAGGIMAYGADCAPTIANNTIAFNSTSGRGGGILCTADSNPTIINNIIIRNTASTGAGGIHALHGGTPNNSYNDVWGNSSDYGGDASAGVGDISLDPLFVDADHGDVHLEDSSPCIGAGRSGPGVPSTDMDGNPRPNPPDSNPDMGAYEHSLDLPLPVALSSFTATMDQERIILHWTTQSETENRGFRVYRSRTEDGHYERITPTTIKGAGSSRELRSYRFIDQEVQPGQIYYYKLEQIDFEGTRVIYGPLPAQQRPG